MKKKKIILIIILSVITLILIGLLILKSGNNNDKEIIQSNKRDETVEQFKVTNEYINIRLEDDSQSETLGKVYKDEIYTILEKKEDDYYVWYLIETNNKIKGYVAVQYEEESYIELLEVKGPEDNEKVVE